MNRIYITFIFLLTTTVYTQAQDRLPQLGSQLRNDSMYSQMDSIHIQALVSPHMSFDSVLYRVRNLYHVRITLSIRDLLYFEGIIDAKRIVPLVKDSIFYNLDVIQKGVPEATHDRPGAIRSNWLVSDITGINYDGTGITIGIREEGKITDDDINFAGRQKNGYQTGGVESHKEGVASHMTSAGNRNPRHIGIAYGSDFYDLPSGTLNFSDLYNTKGVTYLNRSSGEKIVDAIYSIDAKNKDQTVYANPELLFIYSAGNANGNSPNYSYGPYSQLDGTEFGTITLDEKMSKNNIVAQAITQYDDSYSYGSRGPTYDGRIKPDLTSDGELGTSHAAPKITGVLAQLNQAYRDWHGKGPESALLKAILFNTADDFGRKGPDFRYGYGTMNARRAYNALKENRFFTDTIQQGVEHIYQVQLPVDSNLAVEFKTTLTWCDPSKDISDGTPDTALVNDLDLYLEVDGVFLYPWVLNTYPHEDSLRLDATRGVDRLNNTEQVTFNIPSTWLGKTISLHVKGHHLDVGYPKQNYYLAYEIVKKELILTTPLGNEKWEPGDEQIIRWDAYGVNSKFLLEYKEQQDSDWITLKNNIDKNKRHFVWNIPNEANYYFKKFHFKISTISETLADSSQAVHLAPVPKGLTFAYKCDSTYYFFWDKLDTNNVNYYIHHLDGKYMQRQEITFTDTLAYCVSPFHHYAISCEREGVESRRSLAISPSRDSVYCSATRVHEIKSAIQVFPNPATNYVVVKDQKGGKLNLVLFDSSGKSVLQAQGIGAVHLDISEQVPGFYFLVITDNKRDSLVEKIIKL